VLGFQNFRGSTDRMATWLKLAATSLLGVSIAMACTVGDPDDEPFDDDDDEEEGGRAGRASGGGGAAGRAGAGGAGGARAGSGGGGAGGSVAGSAGTSGGSGIPTDVACGSEESVGTVPAGSCEFTDVLPEDEACLTCLSGSCCDELKGCYSTSPSDACGWGRAADGQEEYQCYIDCIIRVARADETMSFDDVDKMDCAFECGTAEDGTGELCDLTLFSNSTNELATCMHDNCEFECLIAAIEAP
jgi:hypothetical protein